MPIFFTEVSPPALGWFKSGAVYFSQHKESEVRPYEKD
jgi:hypothetical protein